MTGHGRHKVGDWVMAGTRLVTGHGRYKVGDWSWQAQGW